MKIKRIIYSALSVILAFATVSGNATYNKNNTAVAATNSVYDFDYGPGITWGVEDSLPVFKTPIASSSQPMDVIDISRASESMKYSMMSLQGLVNRVQPRIIISNGDGTRDQWISDLIGENNVRVTTDYLAMINKYRSYINGVVIYDSSQYVDGNGRNQLLNPHSINVAFSVAGAEGYIIASDTYANVQFNSSSFVTNPITKQIDLDGKFAKTPLSAYRWLYENYYKTGKLNKRLIIGLHPTGHTTHFGDYVVATKSAVLWLEPNEPMERRVLDLFYNEATPGVTYNLGWWPGEDTGVGYATIKGVPTVPADFFENATVYSGQSKEISIPTIVAKPKLENKVYVALAFADGDNTQYNQGTMSDMWRYRKRITSQNPEYNNYPISWTASPALYYLAPKMLEYFNTNIVGNDMLICGPSGLGYTKATRWREKAGFLTEYKKRTNAVFEKTGFNIITMWDRISEGTYTAFASNMPALLGSTINNNDWNDADGSNPDSMWNFGGRHYPENTEVAYKSEKPLYGLGGKCGYVGTVSEAMGFVKGRTNYYLDEYPNQPNFIFSQIVPWGNEQEGSHTKVESLLSTAAEYKKQFGDKIEFVRADQFFMLLNEANKVPYNLALYGNASASGTASGSNVTKAVDGSITTGWVSGTEDSKWYKLDLGSRCEISRYALKNAQTGYSAANLNTKAYKFQYSLDGNVWETAQTVTDNTKSIVYGNLSNTIAARYVRILFDNPGADSVARIQDFEVYGTSQNITDDSAPVNVTKISLSASKTTLNMGQTLTLGKLVSPMNATNNTITFRSSNSSYASVNQNGVVTVGKVTSPQSVTITASANDGSGKSASVKLTIRTGKVENIKLFKTSKTLDIGKKFTVKATISPSTAYNKKYTWSTSSKKIATVSSSGVITAKAPGIAYITAKASDAGKKSAKIKITVKPKKVTKVKIKRSSTSAKVSYKKVSGISYYEVFYKKSGGSWKKATTSKKTSATVKKLAQKSKYAFKVRAVKVSDKKKVTGSFSAATKAK